MSTSFESTTAFPSTFKGDVITPRHPDYTEAVSRWAKNAERKAHIVVFVKNAEDVALSLAYAKENGLPVAVRGGGHNSAGASSVEDGLVIDLSRHLNGVRVDVEKRLGYVGGGALWRDVDAEAIKYGLATVGGTVNHTGVAGLTLGGGYGWLSGRHGLALDNLNQVTIVTANGSILTSNANENTDLFWAVRGGGGNFGVVTEFVFQLHPQRKTIFAGFVLFSSDRVEELVEYTAKWWVNPKENEGMAYAIKAFGPGGDFGVAVCLFFNGSEEEGRANFKELFDIGPMLDMAKEIPYEELNTLQNSVSEHGSCRYLRGISVKGPDYQVTKEALDQVREISKAGRFTEATVVFELYPMQKINAIALANTAFRRKAGTNVLILLSWDVDEPGKVKEASDTVDKMVEAITRGLGSFEQAGYLNYCDFIVQEADLRDDAGQRIKEAFGENYPRLQKIKKRYDPENCFNRWFPIAPA